MTEQDRLAGIEQGLREVKNEVGEVKATVAGLKATVELLVEGKIKQSGALDGYSKVALAALEVARLAVAGLVGFFAGRGGN